MLKWMFLAPATALAVLGLAAGAWAGSVEFVGSEACKACHEAAYNSWQETYHNKMVRLRDEGILKDVVEKWASDGANPGPTKGNVTGKARSLDDVQFVIGSKWKQRFLVKNEASGGYEFLDKQFNRATGKWEGYGQKNDWDTQCTTCHATGYRVTQFDQATMAVQKAEWVEPNTGCEACHGPGAKHVKSMKKDDIFSYAGKSVEQRSLVCGYCHSRVENELWHTRQGKPSEHIPAPKAGESYKAGQDDWRTWYPDKLIAPGVHAEDPIDKAYEGDLKGMWILDEQSKAHGFYDAGKHHQQYGEYLQSSHYKKNVAACNDCHSPHAVGGKPKAVPAATCSGCHDASYTVEKYMPGTGKTAGDLYVRTHTFNRNQARKGGTTADKLPEPVYYRK